MTKYDEPELKQEINEKTLALNLVFTEGFVYLGSIMNLFPIKIITWNLIHNLELMVSSKCLRYIFSFIN